MSKPRCPVDELDVPRPIPELAEYLSRVLPGERVSRAKLYRLIRAGCVPATDVGGRKRSTARAVLAAMTPSTRGEAA